MIAGFISLSLKFWSISYKSSSVASESLILSEKSTRIKTLLAIGSPKSFIIIESCFSESHLWILLILSPSRYSLISKISDGSSPETRFEYSRLSSSIPLLILCSIAFFLNSGIIATLQDIDLISVFFFIENNIKKSYILTSSILHKREPQLFELKNISILCGKYVGEI